MPADACLSLFTKKSSAQRHPSYRHVRLVYKHNLFSVSTATRSMFLFVSKLTRVNICRRKEGSVRIRVLENPVWNDSHFAKRMSTTNFDLHSSQENLGSTNQLLSSPCTRDYHEQDGKFGQIVGVGRVARGSETANVNIEFISLCSSSQFLVFSCRDELLKTSQRFKSSKDLEEQVLFKTKSKVRSVV